METNTPAPRRGYIVDYRSNTGQDFPAIVVKAREDADEVELVVFGFNGTGAFPIYASKGEGKGQWRWPETVIDQITLHRIGLGAGVGPSARPEQRPEFTFHLLNDIGKEKAIQVADIFSGTLNRLEFVCGQTGREMSIVRTKLEEACFFAKKAMAVREENQA
jgi:hypothetical protein